MFSILYLSQLAIGCNLCGMFIPGLCATTCPMAGLFCGGSGYLCAIASGENPAPAEPVEAPRSFMVMDDEEDMDGRSFSPKMDMMREMRNIEGDTEPEVEARSQDGSGHTDDDGHEH